MGTLPGSPEDRPTFGKLVGNVARGFFEFLGQIALYFDSLPLEEKQPIKDFMTTLLSKSGAGKQSVDFLVKDDRELKRLLLDRAWWVLQKDITGEMKRELLRLGREGKSGHIDEYLCAHFRADEFAKLQAKVKIWLDVPYLNERQQIISDCLEAHKAGKYTLTIPSLLPLLDGLTRQFRKAHERPRRSKNLRGVIQVNQFAGYYRRKEHKLWGAPFEKFVKQIAYLPFEFGKGQPLNSFNRHGILHGEVPDYATETNSLKVILLLDTAAQFVRAVERRSLSARPASA
jgi:hypothetical protein